jgi:hypothetical protein
MCVHPVLVRYRWRRRYTGGCDDVRHGPKLQELSSGRCPGCAAEGRQPEHHVHAGRGGNEPQLWDRVHQRHVCPSQVIDDKGEKDRKARRQCMKASAYSGSWPSSYLTCVKSSRNAGNPKPVPPTGRELVVLDDSYGRPCCSQAVIALGLPHPPMRWVCLYYEYLRLPVVLRTVGQSILTHVFFPGQFYTGKCPERMLGTIATRL